MYTIRAKLLSNKTFCVYKYRFCIQGKFNYVLGFAKWRDIKKEAFLRKLLLYPYKSQFVGETLLLYNDENV